MRIALIGGTGNIGEGLALRLAHTHEIVVGSRYEEKAGERAEKYRSHLDEEGVHYSGVSGAVNREAAAESDVVVLTVPYRFLEDTVDDIRTVLDEQLVISPIVPMRKDDEFEYAAGELSAAEEVAELVPEGCPVVSAFQTLSAVRLKKVARDISLDVVVSGDDEDAKETVFGLVEQMDNLTPWDGGSLAMSRLVESLTPLLLNLGVKNGRSNLGVKFV